MKSTSDVIKQIIESDWQINQAHKLGLLNNRRLAAYLKPQVEAELGRKISNDAVNQAIYRLNKDPIKQGHKNRILGESTLKLQDNITLYYLKEDAPPAIIKTKAGARNLSIHVKGMGLNTLIVDRESQQKTRLKKEAIIKKMENLSALILASPPEIVETPGVIAKLMTVLGAKKINVAEIFSSFDTTLILVEEDQSMKALETIRKLIKT